MNKLKRDISLNEIVIDAEGQMWEVFGGFGMKHDNIGKALYARSVALDGTTGKDYNERIDETIDAEWTEMHQRVFGKSNEHYPQGNVMILSDLDVDNLTRVDGKVVVPLTVSKAMHKIANKVSQGVMDIANEIWKEAGQQEIEKPLPCLVGTINTQAEGHQQLGTETGRIVSDKPNLEEVPRIVATPEGTIIPFGQSNTQDVEDYELEGQLIRDCNEATDVMSEERIIEILVESMDVKSQREAMCRIRAEMESEVDNPEDDENLDIELTDTGLDYINIVPED